MPAMMSTPMTIRGRSGLITVKDWAAYLPRPGIDGELTGFVVLSKPRTGKGFPKPKAFISNALTLSISLGSLRKSLMKNGLPPAF